MQEAPHSAGQTNSTIYLGTSVMCAEVQLAEGRSGRTVLGMATGLQHGLSSLHEGRERACRLEMPRALSCRMGPTRSQRCISGTCTHQDRFASFEAAQDGAEGKLTATSQASLQQDAAPGRAESCKLQTRSLAEQGVWTRTLHRQEDSLSCLACWP